MGNMKVKTGEELQEDLDKIIKDRELSYGASLECHKNIALAWQGIINQSCKTGSMEIVIDETDVALMLAAMKIIREAYCHKQDNIDDAINYLRFASDFSKEMSIGFP